MNKASATDVNFLLHLKTFYEQNKDTTPEETLNWLFKQKLLEYFKKQEGKT